MKTTLKKLSAIILAAVMASTMLITALAAAPLSLPPSQGDLVIHKMIMTPEQTAANTPGTPATGNPTTPVPGNPLDGIEFNVYQVTIVDNVYPATGVLDTTNMPASFKDSTGTVFTVTYVDSQTTANDVTYGDGVALFTDLDQGVYLVPESEDTTGLVDVPSDPFVVAVPMTNAAGDGWINPVHVYPKNEKLTIDKTVNKTSVNVGEAVSYTLTPQIPAGIDYGAPVTYSVTDKLDAALDFVNVSQVLEAKNKADFVSSPLAMTSGTDYQVTQAGSLVTITLTQAGKDKLAANGDLYLQITLNANVNKNILNNTDYTIKNTASINYTNKFGEEKLITSTSADLHTANVTITKVDAKTNDPLEGAKFKIASSSAYATSGQFLKWNPTTKAVYDVNDPGYATAPEYYEVTTGRLIDPDTGLADPNAGLAAFQGLRDYTVAAGADPAVETNRSYITYYLVETQAPTGYNLYNAPIPAEFSSATAETGSPAFTAHVTVPNSNKFLLPITGGAGTVMFTLGGVLLIGLATLLLVLNSKKRKAKAGQ